MATQQQLHVICSYILDFCLCCKLGDTICGIVLLLLKVQNCCMISDKKKFQQAGQYLAYLKTNNF